MKKGKVVLSFVGSAFFLLLLLMWFFLGGMCYLAGTIFLWVFPYKRMGKDPGLTFFLKGGG